MTKYRFSLERVLRLRKHHELEWELKLAAATGRCTALQNELSAIGHERGQTLATRFGLAGGDANQLFRTELYLRRLSQSAETKRKQLEQRERERAEVRDQYLLASRERKVLDRLKDKRAEQHYRKELREEVKAVDDLTSGRVGREVG